jgi:signal transduction histidine kinase
MGAVLIHAPLKEAFGPLRHGLVIMAVSLVAALVIGFVAALLMSRKFTKPLLKINDTALQISEGDYSARTEVKQGDEIGVLAQTIDEMGTKLETAENESRKLQELRQDFIANISHELRTPVTVMRGSLEALCDGVVTEPELVEQYHTELLKESKYMQRMVNDLLDLSRLQNPDFSMNITDFNLFDCVSDAVRGARGMADNKGISVDFIFDTGDLPFRGDYDRVRQMLLIVLDNAVKFSERPNYPVRVLLKEGRVSVTNVGKGIGPDELPYIFERFYRSRSEINKNGTGLGLPIARQIALRHGIGISVTSEPDAETTFVFDFNGGGA